jgi:hypothetical protein
MIMGANLDCRGDTVEVRAASGIAADCYFKSKPMQKLDEVEEQHVGHGHRAQVDTRRATNLLDAR